MNVYLSNTLRFILLALTQGLILNNVELGWGTHIMLYPLFIMLLPIELSAVRLLLVAFVFGFVVDIFSNTFGLHASASTLFAFLRPRLFKLIQSRDNFEGAEIAHVYAIGSRNFLIIYGGLLLFHHTWFFIISFFKFNDFFTILRNIILSVPISYLISMLVQFIFVPRNQIQR
jgi:rod shape-determining protein MreD